jgi:hypothetical protein
VGQTAAGQPIYLYTDPRSRFVSYVVVLPDGRAFYSDAYGSIGQPRTEVDAEVAGAILTGTLGGLAGGPVGAVLGAIAGAIAGKLLKKQGQ